MTWASGSGCRRLAGSGAVRRRLLVAWVLLPSLFLRVLVPPGFMPMPAEAGQSLTMAMCPAHAALPRTTPPPQSPPAPSDRRQEPPCVFAAAGTLAPFAVVPDLVGPGASSLEADTPVATAPPPRAVVRAHQPRAPPVRA